MKRDAFGVTVPGNVDKRGRVGTSHRPCAVERKNRSILARGRILLLPACLILWFAAATPAASQPFEAHACDLKSIDPTTRTRLPRPNGPSAATNAPPAQSKPRGIVGTSRGGTGAVELPPVSLTLPSTQRIRLRISRGFAVQLLVRTRE